MDWRKMARNQERNESKEKKKGKSFYMIRKMLEHFLCHMDFGKESLCRFSSPMVNIKMQIYMDFASFGLLHIPVGGPWWAQAPWWRGQGVAAPPGRLVQGGPPWTASGAPGSLFAHKN